MPKPKTTQTRHRKSPGAKARGKAKTAELAITGLPMPIEVRRHPSARRLTLRVSQTRRTVIVTVPQRCRLEEAGLFVNRHLDWVRERLGDLPDPIAFEDGIEIPIRGVPHLVRFIGPQRSGPVVRIVTGRRSELHVKGRMEHAPRRLKDWLIEQARLDLEDRVAYHTHQLDLRARRISVRDQASRWGSCSTTGLLSFSWRLILAPPVVLDYVAAHEVAHLGEMNHGPRFWALVLKTMPDMRSAKSWLHTHGLQLHRYGAKATPTFPTTPDC
jgi:predicted metal-dependent hydrolase